MPAITSHDEPWPFFHFWRYHFWPKLASSKLNFCRRKRSFRWCSDQSDRPKGAWDMHKNAQNVEQKTRTKICRHHTWLLHGKSCPSRWRFPRSFLTAREPSRRPITAAKRKGQKKIPKIKKRKDIVFGVESDLSQNFDFCACPSQNVPNRNASGKKTKLLWCKCIFDQIEANLAEIQPKNHQNVQEMPFSQKALGLNGLT